MCYVRHGAAGALPLHLPDSALTWQHIDLGDSSVVDDKVCFHIGNNCPRLRTLSLRGSPLSLTTNQPEPRR